MLSPHFSRILGVFLLTGVILNVSASQVDATGSSKNRKVLILGGGVAGVIAARTLHDSGISDFVIIEARGELGGRMMSATFANKTIEQGPNWIQGTQDGNGTANPIFTLAKKHNIKSQFNDWFGSICGWLLCYCLLANIFSIYFSDIRLDWRGRLS